MKHWLIACLIWFLPMLAWAGYDFDGTDDCITGAVASLPGTGVTSLSVFIVAKMDSASAGQYLNSRADSTGQVWHIFTSGTGNISADMPFGSGVNAPFCRGTTSNAFSAGDVVRLAISYSTGGNCAGSTMLLNLNGTETSSSAFIYTTTGTNASMAIGASNATTCANFTNGQIYELAVWNAALSSNELSQLVNSYEKRIPYRVKPGNLKGYWEMNEGVDGASADGASIRDEVNAQTLTASDGANNTGMTGDAERVSSYP